MNRISKKHSILSLMLLIVLIAAVALFAAACDDTRESASTEALSTAEDTSATETSSVTEVGEGTTSFEFTVKLADGTTRDYVVNTDKSIVGDALDEAGLIEYADGQYGRFVTHVCGEKHVFDDDATYWAFYVNGEYALTGVDSTEIKPDEVYSFEVGK